MADEVLFLPKKGIKTGFLSAKQVFCRSNGKNRLRNAITRICRLKQYVDGCNPAGY